MFSVTYKVDEDRLLSVMAQAFSALEEAGIDAISITIKEEN